MGFFPKTDSQWRNFGGQLLCLSGIATIMALTVMAEGEVIWGIVLLVVSIVTAARGVQLLRR